MTAPFPPLERLVERPLPSVHIVDVGAAILDTPSRFAALPERGAARVTAFEPSDEERARLQAAHLRGYSILPYAVGLGGPATFHVTRYPGCSSLYRPDPAVIDLFTGIGASPPNGNFLVRHEIPIETHRIDALSEVEEIDYLKVDVQGAELDVLRGAEAKLAHATVIECEVEFLPLYEGQPLLGDVQTYLRDQGFVLHKLLDVQGRALRPVVLDDNIHAPLSQLLWADAIFVRDYTRELSQWTTEQLLRAAVVLHEIYRSVDVAGHLLAELDRREGTKLQATYLNALAGASVPIGMSMVQVNVG